MTPRADYSCLSKKCRTPEGAAPTYELPVGSTRCPVCGSKRLQWIIAPPNINRGAAPDHFDSRRTSSSLAARVDLIAEPAVTAAYAKKTKERELRNKYPMVSAVPMRQLGQKLQEVYASGGVAAPVRVDGRQLTQKATLGGSVPGDTGSLMGEMQRRPVRPNVAAVDREFRIVRGEKGPEVGKA